jgi:hypothetical protein
MLLLSLRAVWRAPGGAWEHFEKLESTGEVSCRVWQVCWWLSDLISLLYHSYCIHCNLSITELKHSPSASRQDIKMAELPPATHRRMWQRKIYQMHMIRQNQETKRSTTRERDHPRSKIPLIMPACLLLMVTRSLLL